MAIGYTPKHGVDSLELVNMLAADLWNRNHENNNAPEPNDEQVREYKQKSLEVIKHAAWELKGISALF